MDPEETKRTPRARVSRFSGAPAKALLSFIAGLLSLLAGTSTFFLSSVEDKQSKEQENKIEIQSIEIGQSREVEVRAISAELKELQKHILSISNIPKEDALSIEISKLNSSVQDISGREGKLEDAIIENPSRALEVPILRKDIDDLRSSQSDTFAALKDSIDRVYDLNKWLLGAMAVSVVTLALSNLLKPKDPPKP